jgi:hypothetical protein
MNAARFRHCTYVVALDEAATELEIMALAHSLSPLEHAGCEVLVLDPNPDDDRRRILRWVARYEAPSAGGDMLRSAVDLSSCEKIVFASPQTRSTPPDLAALCSLLDVHEAVEPEEFLAPLPWWGSVDAGGLLLHRGADQPPDVRSVFAFRKSAFRLPRGFDEIGQPALRRIVRQGLEVHQARDLFIRREPQQFASWLRSRGREAASDFGVPLKAAFFFGFLPVITLLAVAGGLDLAGGYGSLLGLAALLIAIRGRWGAGHVFPMRVLLYAPVWILARSIAVYAALFEKLRTADVPIISRSRSSDAPSSVRSNRA